MVLPGPCPKRIVPSPIVVAGEILPKLLSKFILAGFKEITSYFSSLPVGCVCLLARSGARDLGYNLNMKKVIVVHGYRSSPRNEKYQIISQKLDELGVEHSIPVFPGGKYPHSREWLEIINREVKNTDKLVVLVGHSLGTRAVLLYLDKFETKVDTVILIATFNNNIKENKKRKGESYADFFEYSLNIEKIKKLTNKFIIVHSKDDDLIDYQQAVDISKELGVELITYENASHFSGENEAEKNAEYFLGFIKSALKIG